MATETLVVREIIVALVGAAAATTVHRSPLAEPYRQGIGYGIIAATAFWCLRLAGLI